MLHVRARFLGSLFLLVSISAAGCAAAPESPAPEPAAPANPLRGVWSLTKVDPGDGSPVIDPSQPGLYIFTEGYYSGVYAPGAEPRVPAATHFQPTDEEMVAQFQSIIVNTGTYEVDGSTITFRPIIAKSPGFGGGSATGEFEISGDALTLSLKSILSVDGTAAPGVAGSLTLRRVE